MADNRSGGDVYTDHLFTGQKQDDTGLLYYRARYYDKLLGAFISPDPVVPDAENVFAYNRYLYGLANPLKYNDPSGHFPFIVIPVLFGVALLLTADTPQPPSETLDESGRLGASLIAGDVNDIVTVVTGYDFIYQEEIGHYTGDWWSTVGWASVPLASGSLVRGAQRYIQPALPGLESYVSRVKPVQLHHFASNNNKKWTPIFNDILQNYGLDLDGAWNKEQLPHLGSHPEKYHEWVQEQMQWIDERAAGDTDRFLQLFEEFVKEPVRKMPGMLDAEYWRGSR